MVFHESVFIPIAQHFYILTQQTPIERELLEVLLESEADQLETGA
jgi:hypothetical protein